MHGANASQNAWQLILPNVCEPLSDGILNDFVNTEEAENANALSFKLSINQTIKRLHMICNCFCSPVPTAEPLQL